MAKNQQESITLVVPCYNELNRLNITAFASAAEKHNLNILFYDDGSSDGTAELIAKATKKFSRLSLLCGICNRGKSAAVREGILYLAKRKAAGDWIGFWDADLATPLEEARRMLDYEYLQPKRSSSVWGSRVMRSGSRVRRRLSRHLLGRLFSSVASLMLNINAYDTQCGAKLFRRHIVPNVFKQPFLGRWTFDLELYCRLGEDNILEYPLSAWYDVAGSKVKITHNILPVFWQLYKMRSIYKRYKPNRSFDRPSNDA